MKNVLSIFVTMPVGGAEIFWLNVLQKLDRSRFNPITCCIADKGVIGERIEGLGFEVIALDRMKGKGFDARAALDIKKLITNRKIDILHLHLYHAGMYGRIAAMLLPAQKRPKCIIHIHNVYSKIKPHRLFTSRLLAGYADAVIAVSEPVKKDVVRYDKIPPEEVTVLPTCIDFDRMQVCLTKEEARELAGLPKDGILMGTVGRLVESKGHSDLIEAVSILRKNGTRIKAVIIGGGRLEYKLREQAFSSGVAEDIIFMGERHDIPMLYRAMDIYVMPSLWEGAPLSLLDGMAAGMPSIVTSVGGMPEQLDNGSCGMIVPPGDPAAMANAISDLISDEYRMEEYSQKAKARSKEYYGSAKVAEKFQKIYLELLKSE